MNIFFDSSAFAKRYIDEHGTDKVVKACQDAAMIAVSSICLPEIVSALCRLEKNKIISSHQYMQAKQSLLDDLNDATICNITPVVIQKSIILLEKNTLRAMDALHIGCALEWKAELLVSSDKRQISAAEKAGLKTVSV
jgi:predicted nucleic acid-binding protein